MRNAFSPLWWEGGGGPTPTDDGSLQGRYFIIKGKSLQSWLWGRGGGSRLDWVPQAPTTLWVLGKPSGYPTVWSQPKRSFFFRHCTTNSWQVVSQTSPKSPCPHIRPPLREPKCGGGVLSGAKGCLGTGDTMMCHDAFFSGGGELSACFEEMLLVKSKCLRVKQWTQETFTFFGAKFRILFPVGSPLCKHNPLVYW